MDEKGLADLIPHKFNKMKPFPDALHRRALSLMREYMLVGGMPEPVSIYVEQRLSRPSTLRSAESSSSIATISLVLQPVMNSKSSPYSMASRVSSLGTKTIQAFLT